MLFTLVVFCCLLCGIPANAQKLLCNLNTDIHEYTAIAAEVIAPLADDVKVRSLQKIPFIVRAVDRDHLVQYCSCEHHEETHCTEAKLIEISDRISYTWSAGGPGSFDYTDRPGVLYSPELSLVIGDSVVQVVTVTIADGRANDSPVEIDFLLTIKRIAECSYVRSIRFDIPDMETKTLTLSGSCICAPLPERWDAGPGLTLTSPDTLVMCAGERTSITAAGSDEDNITLRCFGDCGKASITLEMSDALEYSWSASIGAFPDYGTDVRTNGPFTSVVYMAPDSGGTGFITVSLEDSGIQGADYIEKISFPIRIVELDLGLEGFAEALELCPGALLFVNSDDDNRNAIADKDDVTSYTSEDDLVKLRLKAVAPGDLVRLSAPAGSAKIRLWAGPDKFSELSLPLSFPADDLPPELWLEGIEVSGSPGDVVLMLESMETACADTLKLTVLNADLDVDTDRNGIVNAADEFDEHQHSKARGAFFNVNHDADERRSGNLPDALHFNRYGKPKNEDRSIRASADLADITPLIIAKTGPVPPGVAVYLRVAELEDIQSIHMYKRIAPKENAIWGSLGNRIGVGSSPEPLFKRIGQWTDAAADVSFGIEGLFYANNTWISTRFDGEIDITLEFRAGASVLASDNVRLKVAPWIMLPNTMLTEKFWAVKKGPENTVFLYNASAESGYVGMDNSSQLGVIDKAQGKSVWAQDHVQIGYTQRPGGPKAHSTLRMPYKLDNMYTQPPWPRDTLLAGSRGLFQLGATLMGGGGDYGGNLELIPGDASFPLGRILIGNSCSSKLLDFLNRQNVQQPIIAPVRWLAVAHVDEVIGFTNDSARFVIADPQTAWNIMTAIPAADRGKAVFFAKGASGPVFTVSAGSDAEAENDTLKAALETGGPVWQYLRVFESSVGAEGQVAKIRELGDGYIIVDTVWDTGKGVIYSGSNPNNFYRNTIRRAPNRIGWFITPAVGDKFVVVEGTQYWSLGGGPRAGTPAIITVQELLADSLLEQYNVVRAQAEINALRSKVETAFTGTPPSFVKLPVIFAGKMSAFSTNRSGIALSPDLANFQVVEGDLYFPRPFAPRNSSGTDLFEAYTRTEFPDALFVDDWNGYHRHGGEVHCGTVTLRRFFPFDWWLYIP